METKSFAELGLSTKVLAAVESAGYLETTAIQSQAIPVALSGRDVLGIAQTGTGKTAAFTLPMITRLEAGRARARMPRSLILAPTRELAAQVENAFEKYGKNNRINIALLIGGVSIDEQIKKLDRGVDVLIATPGRLLDHFQRGRIMLMGVEILVIDEADRMLDMGFIPDIEKICRLLPPRRQTLFFSATMPPEVTKLVQQFLKDPVRIEVSKQASTAKTITQRFCYCPDNQDWQKREILRNLLRSETLNNAIIFCNRKRDVSILHKSLLKHGFNAGALHGDMDQKSRMETLLKFRSGALTILAASDVAARGLDIPEVSHVFNFDLPWQTEDYVHRIGRTGRAGREGKAFSIVTQEELKLVKDIEKLIGEKTVWMGDVPIFEPSLDIKSGSKGRGAKKSSQKKSQKRPNDREQYRVQTQTNTQDLSSRGDLQRNHQGPTFSENANNSTPSRVDPLETKIKRPSNHQVHSTMKSPSNLEDQKHQKKNRMSETVPKRYSSEPPHKKEKKYTATSLNSQSIHGRSAKAASFDDVSEHVPAFLRKPSRPIK